MRPIYSPMIPIKNPFKPIEISIKIVVVAKPASHNGPYISLPIKYIRDSITAKIETENPIKVAIRNGVI